MDAFGDYVWPRATSELILLPVTGLECVGDRLLAGEAWSALIVLAGEELASPLGWSHRTKGCPREEDGQRAGDWQWDKAGSEVAGKTSQREEGGARETKVCRSSGSSS